MKEEGKKQPYKNINRQYYKKKNYTVRNILCAETTGKKNIIHSARVV
jgi:hypothetical protein